MAKQTRRTPQNYNGTGITTHHVNALLQKAMRQIGEKFQERPDMVMLAWPQVVGPKLTEMSQAVSFDDGILIVKVKNSTLHSLLSQHDKPRIIGRLRQMFPKIEIKNIYFRIG